MNPFRALPSVEALLSLPELVGLPHALAVEAVRDAIAAVREAIRDGGDAPSPEQIAADAGRRARSRQTPTLRRAINATGVVLHTNLGRATLAPEAAAAVAAVAGAHATLEVDEETGGRGSRQDHCRELLRRLTGAEDAFVVNNNAAATYLAVAGLAAGRDVILSRGEMVEIGGHFRLPDVIASSGARLVEVGTTNRTRIDDYARALSDQSGLLLRCHPSNFQIVGFSESPALAQLVALSRQHAVPFADDIGSGALVDLSTVGLRDEPTAPGSVAAGADLVFFSGDKLLGGPQCGILVGKAALLRSLARHPLARALRPDKLTLAALEATLRLYAYDDPWTHIPTLRRLVRPADAIRRACRRLAKKIPAASVVPVRSQIGGGSLPGQELPSWALALTTNDSASLAHALRQRAIPIYGRIERDTLLLDLRTVDPDEEALLLAALSAVESP